MTPREKNLALLVGAMVVLWGASIGWGKYQTALEKNQNIEISTAQELSTAKTAELRGRRAQSKLRNWNKQSLPTDPDYAKSLYQDWLRQQLTSAGLNVKSLIVTTPQSRSKNFQEFSFTVSATGNLTGLADFLYAFYQSKHLHRISQTTLTPADDRKGVTIALTIDALSLPKGVHTDKLAEGTMESFQHPLDSFKETIEQRNVFAKYEAPKTEVAKVEAPPETPKDDKASKATFSGIHYGESGWLMLVRMQDSGKLFYFREGDEIHIGQFDGTVELLDGQRRRAVIDTGRQRVQLQFGKSLAEAVPVRGRPS